ncbi:MAG: SoxR reducing system RseC family protein [Rhodospirillaceae bacterium]
MTGPEPDEPGSGLESVARVVALEGGVPWLEPEPKASCGGCLSLAACGAKGGGRRALAARRFPLAGAPALRVGERVVVGLPEGAVLRASATAYAVPLLLMVGAGITARGLGAGDGAGALAMLGGLAAGLLIARIIAGLLLGRGDLSPRYLRRVVEGGACSRD